MFYGGGILILDPAPERISGRGVNSGAQAWAWDVKLRLNPDFVRSVICRSTLRRSTATFVTVKTFSDGHYGRRCTLLPILL